MSTLAPPSLLLSFLRVKLNVLQRTNCFGKEKKSTLFHHVTVQTLVLIDILIASASGSGCRRRQTLVFLHAAQTLWKIHSQRDHYPQRWLAFYTADPVSQLSVLNMGRTGQINVVFKLPTFTDLYLFDFCITDRDRDSFCLWCSTVMMEMSLNSVSPQPIGWHPRPHINCLLISCQFHGECYTWGREIWSRWNQDVTIRAMRHEWRVDLKKKKKPTLNTLCTHCSVYMYVK